MPLYYLKLEDVTVAQIEAIKLARRCATLAPTLWTALFHLRGLFKGRAGICIIPLEVP
jgi:hypothetical protein